jgi:hypothetical protein
LFGWEFPHGSDEQPKEARAKLFNERLKVIKTSFIKLTQFRCSHYTSFD